MGEIFATLEHFLFTFPIRLSRDFAQVFVMFMYPPCKLSFVTLRDDTMPTAAAMTIAVLTTPSTALVALMYSRTALSRSWPYAFVGKHFTNGPSGLFFLCANACAYLLLSRLAVDSVIFRSRTLEKCLAAWVLPFSRAY